jgi:putative transposase
MPRRPRAATGGLVYHVLNRRVGGLELFDSEADYAAFERVMVEAQGREPTRLLGYCLMPTHWHLVLWPTADGELSELMRWLTVTHTQRWHAHRQSAGSGPVYQGRFKSFPVQDDEHLLTVLAYVERNPMRAGLVRVITDWRWSSLPRWPALVAEGRPELSDWPAERPPAWLEFVRGDLPQSNLAPVRECVRRGAPYGHPAWVKSTAAALGLESALRPRGRPRKQARD